MSAEPPDTSVPPPPGDGPGAPAPSPGSRELADARRRAREARTARQIRGPRDVDAFERAVRLPIAAYSIAGLVMGAAAGFMAGHPILGALIGAGGVFAVAYGIVGTAGKGAAVLHNPSGATTPHAPEFSYAEALAVQGRFEDAVEAFEEAAREHPGDPRPLLRIAHIQRDDLGRLEDAARTLRRLLSDASRADGTVRLARRELIELYVYRLGEPRRAAPVLARMAEELAGTPEGDWAAGELTRIKKAMTEEPPG